MRKLMIWGGVVQLCAIGVFLYVGQRYFDGFNNVGSQPRCVSDCWENGKRIR